MTIRDARTYTMDGHPVEERETWPWLYLAYYKDDQDEWQAAGGSRSELVPLEWLRERLADGLDRGNRYPDGFEITETQDPDEANWHVCSISKREITGTVVQDGYNFVVTKTAPAAPP